MWQLENPGKTVIAQLEAKPKYVILSANSM